MSSDIAISVKNLTKTYRIFNHPGDRIKQALTFGRVKFHKEFTALKDVSFEIRRGETVGIIGRNGSGKSTLLQLICGILKPTSGSVIVNGRISALLELGSGFNPEFTGRENIYFQGVIMGFTPEEMDARVEDIIAFADIGEFIDQPVRTYSSGMFVRLAFAVAVHVDPEVLVIDEALAVGDSSFQTKCLKRINLIRNDGASILFVTHSLEQIAHFCDRALLLDRSAFIALGETAQVLDEYIYRTNNSLFQNNHVQCDEYQADLEDIFEINCNYNTDETRWGDKAAVIISFCLIQSEKVNPQTFVAGMPCEVRIRISFKHAVERPIYGFTLKSKGGGHLCSTNSRELLVKDKFLPQPAGSELEVVFCFSPFLDQGEYLISVGVASETESGIQPHDRRYDSIKFRIQPPYLANGDVDFQPSIHIHQ